MKEHVIVMRFLPAKTGQPIYSISTVTPEMYWEFTKLAELVKSAMRIICKENEIELPEGENSLRITGARAKFGKYITIRENKEESPLLFEVEVAPMNGLPQTEIGLIN